MYFMNLFKLPKCMYIIRLPGWSLCWTQATTQYSGLSRTARTMLWELGCREVQMLIKMMKLGSRVTHLCFFLFQTQLLDFRRYDRLRLWRRRCRRTLCHGATQHGSRTWRPAYTEEHSEDKVKKQIQRKCKSVVDRMTEWLFVVDRIIFLGVIIMTAPITCAASLLVNTRVNLVSISILKISRYVCRQHWCWYNLWLYYSKVVSVIRVANRIPKKPMDLGQSTLLSSSVVSQPLFLTKSASKSSTPILDWRLKRAQIQIIG